MDTFSILVDGVGQGSLLLKQQLRRGNSKRLRELLDDRYRRVPLPAFDITDVGPVDPGAIGIVLLAPALLGPKPANVSSKAGAYIHAELKTRLSPIGLQTISDIGVDCYPSPSIGRCH